MNLDHVRQAAQTRDDAEAAAAAATVALHSARRAKRTAQAEFATTLVNAHATGASMRTLAHLAGISHQRVAQLVNAA